MFTKLEDDLDIIAKLDNEPNDVGGMSAAELKAEFDKAGNVIKNYINEVLIPALRAVTAAENIGCDITNVEGDNLWAAMTNLKEQIDEISHSQGGLTPGAINNQNFFADDVVPSRAVDFKYAASDSKGGRANGTKGNLLFADMSSYNGTGDVSLTAAKAGALPADTKYAGAANAGGAANSVANSVIFKNDGAGAVAGTGFNGSIGRTVSYNTIGAQKKHSTESIDLQSGGTSWTVPLSDIRSTSSVIVSPAPESWSVWTECGMRCSEQSAGQLKFAAETAPSITVTVNVIWFD